MRCSTRLSVGKNYMVIATIPTTVIEVATELGMIDSMSQWLFLVANTKGFRSNTSTLMSFVKEGGNVAVATNASNADMSCDMSNDCTYHQVFRYFAFALSKIVREEEAMYGQISDEEWEAIRLTKRERRDSMLMHIRRHIRESPMCQSCIQWTFEAAETWGLRFADMIGNKLMPFKPKVTDAAVWEPTTGLIINDAIFPHIEFGFRNKTLPIAIFHVSTAVVPWLEVLNLLCSQNPPWQIVSYNEGGDVTSLNGISVHILDELARKLNFTWVDLSRRTTNSGTHFRFPLQLCRAPGG